MTWSHLAFLHWPIPVAQLRPLIPPSLEIDTFDGSAWIGVVPFYMSGVRHRPLPPLPGCSHFPELNVRTYVTCDDKPGVWFLTLDAMSRVVVWAARYWFSLPYYYAQMRCEATAEEVRYQSTRHRRSARHAGSSPASRVDSRWWVEPRGKASFHARYRPTGPAHEARPGTLDFFLTARYCLYCCRPSGQICRGEIDHPPWPLQPAEVDIEQNTMIEVLGLSIPETAPLVHYVNSIETIAWQVRPVEAERASAASWSKLAEE